MPLSGRGLPTASPAGRRIKYGRFGLRRYERVCTRNRSRVGQVVHPTRNFATLGTLLLRQTAHSKKMQLSEAGTFLPSSSCRHEGRTISSPPDSMAWWAWRVVSEDPLSGFLLIARTGRIVTARRHPNYGVRRRRVPPDTRMFQHIAKFCNSQVDTSPL